MDRVLIRPILAAICVVALTGASGCVGAQDDVETTGSILGGIGNDLTPAQSLRSTRNGLQDLELGKRHYRERNFGLAEQHFRRAAEKAPQEIEAWIGLAASYDQLGRFDLADRAYEQAIILDGPSAAILNNQGYSLMLRGDYEGARAKLNEASALEPENRHIIANIDLLNAQ